MTIINSSCSLISLPFIIVIVATEFVITVRLKVDHVAIDLLELHHHKKHLEHHLIRFNFLSAKRLVQELALEILSITEVILVRYQHVFLIELLWGDGLSIER